MNFLNLDYIDFFLFLFAILIHEIAHYIGFKIFNFTPSIKIKPLSIEIGENVGKFLTPKQMFIVLSLGVIAGFPVIQYSFELIVLYIIVSSADILNLIFLIQNKNFLKNKPIYKINQEELNEFYKTNNIKKSELI